MKRRLTQEESIRRCKEVHGNKYDYSQVDYQGSSKKIKIICKKHGYFYQIYKNHVKGNDCPECGKIQRVQSIRDLCSLTQEEALSRIKKIHKNIYDYNNFKYINMNSKIEIICKTHGSFWQIYKLHYKGRGCPDCGGTKRLSQEEALTRLKCIHKNKYDYSLMEYNAMNGQIKIICPKHGIFSQEYRDHAKGHGCASCSDSKPLTQEEAILRLKSVHSEYDYSDVKYINSSSKIEIICRIHGPFWQTYSAHANGQGCPECRQIGSYTYEKVNNDPNLKNKISIYYTAELSNDTECFVKKGITIQSSAKDRLNKIPYNIKILKEEKMTLLNAVIKEQKIKIDNIHLKYNPNIKFGGHTECFTLEILQQE
jgi:hypothetical protein